MTSNATQKSPARRMGVEGAETREQLIDVATTIVEQEGCDAVTARRLSEQLGLKRQIVHYYFRSIEDLLIAVIRRQGDSLRERLRAALAAGESSETIWKPGPDSQAATFEFIIRATRSEAVRAVISGYLTEFRDMRAKAIEADLLRRGVRPNVPPIVISTILTVVGQAFALEDAIGVSLGHAEARSYIENWLARIQAGAPD